MSNASIASLSRAMVCFDLPASDGPKVSCNLSYGPGCCQAPAHARAATSWGFAGWNDSGNIAPVVCMVGCFSHPADLKTPLFSASAVPDIVRTSRNSEPPQHFGALVRQDRSPNFQFTYAAVRRLSACGRVASRRGYLSELPISGRTARPGIPGFPRRFGHVRSRHPARQPWPSAPIDPPPREHPRPRAPLEPGC